MRNILEEKPADDLHGRLAYTMTFVADDDLVGKSVLEIGCGYGWFARHALERGISGITGVEPTDEDLATIRKHVVADNARFELGSALQLPFPDASFDTVVCWEVIEHLPKHSEPTMFSEISRVLRDGGAFYMSTPYGSLRSTVSDPLRLPIGHRHYLESDLGELGRNAAMTLTRTEVKGRWWYVAEIWNVHVSKWLLRRAPVFQDTFFEKTDREFEGPGFACIFAELRRLPR